MNISVEISFGPSTSSRFPLAVKLATESGDCTVAAGRATAHLMVDPTSQNIPAIRELYRMVGNWKGTTIRITGAECGLPLSKLLDEIERICACHDRRLPDDMLHMYCSRRLCPNGDASCFGCRLLEGLQRLPHERFDPVAWWQFGSLSDDLATFTANKPAILAYLRNRTAGQLCTLCPAWSWKRLEQDVADLPNTIDLDDDSPFCVAYSELNPLKPDGVKVRAPYLGAPRWLTP